MIKLLFLTLFLNTLLYSKDKPLFSFAVSSETLPRNLVWENGKESKSFASDKATKGGTWNTYILKLPMTLREIGPNSNSSFRSAMELGNMALVARHPKTNKYIPGIAQQWAVGQDKKTVYFKIDPAAKWSDGQAIVVDDFIFTLKLLRSKEIQSPWHNNYFNTEIDQILKFDKLTFAIRNTKQTHDPVYYTNFPAMPYHFYGNFSKFQKILPVSHAVKYLRRNYLSVSHEVLSAYQNFQKEIKAFEETPANKKATKPLEPEVKIECDTLPENWIELYNWAAAPKTGPYVFSEINRKGVIFKRNKTWWAKDRKFYKNRFNPDIIHYHLLPDKKALLNAYLKGDIDQFNLSQPVDWHSEILPKNFFENGYMQRIWYYTKMPQPSRQISFNLDDALLKNKNLRLGIIYSLNLSKMLKEIFKNDYERAETFNSGYGEYTNPHIKARRYDVKKAIEFFEKSGFSKLGEDGIRINQVGERLSFNLLHFSNNLQNALELLVQEAKKSGLELKLSIKAGNEGFLFILDKKHQIAWHGWSAASLPAYKSLFHQLYAHKKRNNNISNFDDDTTSQLIDDYTRTLSKTKKVKLAHKVEQRLFNLAPAIPIYQVPYFRQANWCWVKFPESIATKTSEMLMDSLGLFWIDQHKKQKILDALKLGAKITGNKKFIKHEENRQR